jgi:hypothetical protein
MMTGPSVWSERVYRLLLRLYPADFRARYGRAMADFHRDRVAEARRQGSSMTALWVRTIVDVASAALAERVRASVPGAISREQIAQDVGYACRGIARRPAFSVIVAGTIALGVGANAAIFSVVSGVLLRRTPYPRIRSRHPRRGLTTGPARWRRRRCSL